MYYKNIKGGRTMPFIITNVFHVSQRYKIVYIMCNLTVFEFEQHKHLRNK